VGCGLFGESHLQAFRMIPQARIEAVFDTVPERAERLAREFQIPKVCASLDELCGLPEIQAVDVVTPEQLHREPVLTALARGKHVFVEKPLATDLDHCAQMIEAAAQADRYLMVGHVLRFETKYAMLREKVASGALGEVVSVHGRRNRRQADLQRYCRAHLVLETGIHDIDMMLWCVGKPVRRVRGYERQASQAGCPDTFWGILEFEGGAIGVVETIWMLPSEAGVVLDDAFQVVGTTGVAQLQLMPSSLSFWRQSGFEVPDVSYDPRVMGGARGALRDELAYFCDSVLNQRPLTVNTAPEARRAVRVALALMEPGGEPWLGVSRR